MVRVLLCFVLVLVFGFVFVVEFSAGGAGKELLGCLECGKGGQIVCWTGGKGENRTDVCPLSKMYIYTADEANLWRDGQLVMVVEQGSLAENSCCKMRDLPGIVVECRC